MSKKILFQHGEPDDDLTARLPYFLMSMKAMVSAEEALLKSGRRHVLLICKVLKFVDVYEGNWVETRNLF